MRGYKLVCFSLGMILIGISLLAPATLEAQTKSTTKKNSSKADRETNAAKVAREKKEAEEKKADRGEAFNEALAKATKTGLPLVVFGTSEGCHICAAFKERMASDPNLKLLLTQYVSTEIPAGSKAFHTIWNEIIAQDKKYGGQIGVPAVFIFTSQGEALYSGPARQGGMQADDEFKQLLVSSIEKNGGLHTTTSTPAPAELTAEVTKARKLLADKQPLAAAGTISKFVAPETAPEDVAALVKLTGLKVAKSKSEEQLDAIVQELSAQGLALVESATALGTTEPLRGAVRLAELNRAFGGYPAFAGKFEAAWKELAAKAGVANLKEQAELIDKARQAETGENPAEAISAYEHVTTTYPNTKAAELSQVRIAQLQGPKKSAARLWRSKNEKFTVTAELVAFDGKAAQLRTAEGKTVSVPFDSLSTEDQQFLSSAKPQN